MKTFTIHYELEVELTEDQLYPEANGSDELGEITVEKVKSLIKRSGGMQRVINDWYLYPSGVLTITEKR